MKVTIPVAGVELDSTGTNRIYRGQLPVWSTRPLTITCEPDFDSGVGYDMTVRVVSGGGFTDESTKVFPFAFKFDIDLSFAAFFLNRADRNKSEYIPVGYVEIWSKSKDNRIKIPLFHADLTYWHTIGVQSSLPQPPKPRIYGQTLDILFPFRVDRNTSYKVEAEPVDGYPSTAIFPVAYTPGETIDIQYIKKLTIKNLFGKGLDYTIDYENRLHTSVGEDPAELCALRARWNMQNGQWFWASFKDFYWTNKFTTIRGRGGVTEQAILTVNLEYGKEWYEVYQQLLTSSNIVFNLAIDGISQYADKSFRAEVSGDTGARWSNSTKTYRQQVQFRTIELQDNYLFPNRPDTPETPAITFSAQFNPWTVGAAYAEGLTNSIYSNAAWEVQSEPSWLAVTSGTTLLTPDLFEQGSILFSSGSTWEQAKVGSSTNIRLKKPFTEINNDEYLIIANTPEYECVFDFLDEYGKLYTNSGWRTMNGKVISGRSPQVAIRIKRTNGAAITPADITTLNAHWGKYRRQFPAGTSNLTATVSANNGEARTGNIVLGSLAGSATYNIAVTQAGNITVDTPTFNVDYLTHPVTVNVTSFGNWSVSARDTWITPNKYAGANGTTAVTLTIADNTSNNDARTGTITFYNDTTGNIAVVTVIQNRAPSTVGAQPYRLTNPKTEGSQNVTILSSGDWTVGSKPSFVAVAPQTGSAGPSQVVVEFQANDTGMIRQGTLLINSGGQSAIVLITQEG